METEDVDSSILTITRLGLSANQATVYVTLATSGTASAQLISQNTNIDRSDVYKILKKLETFGLVERIISKPLKFRAISIRNAVSILLERKVKQTSELSSLAKTFIRNLPKFDLQEMPQEDYQFILVPAKTLNIRRKNAIENAQKNIDIAIPWNTLKKLLFNLEEPLAKALLRGVKIRIITEKNKNISKATDILGKLNLLGSLEVKYAYFPLEIRLAIFDRERVELETYGASSQTDPPTLFSNDPHCLSITTHYFNSLWLKAKKDAQ